MHSKTKRKKGLNPGKSSWRVFYAIFFSIVFSTSPLSLTPTCRWRALDTPPPLSMTPFLLCIHVFAPKKLLQSILCNFLLHRLSYLPPCRSSLPLPPCWWYAFDTPPPLLMTKLYIHVFCIKNQALLFTLVDAATLSMLCLPSRWQGGTFSVFFPSPMKFVVSGPYCYFWVKTSHLKLL